MSAALAGSESAIVNSLEHARVRAPDDGEGAPGDESARLPTSWSPSSRCAPPVRQPRRRRRNAQRWHAPVTWQRVRQRGAPRSRRPSSGREDGLRARGRSIPPGEGKAEGQPRIATDPCSHGSCWRAVPSAAQGRGRGVPVPVKDLPTHRTMWLERRPGRVDSSRHRSKKMERPLRQTRHVAAGSRAADGCRRLPRRARGPT